MTAKNARALIFGIAVSLLALYFALKNVDTSSLIDSILSADPAGGLILELGSVESMDTAAAAVLVEILMAGQQRKIKVFLCGPSPSVQRLFQLSGLDEALECCCDTPAGVQEKLRDQAPA